MAGVELIRSGRACPVGSLTQMGTIRLGKRTEGRSPLIKKLVPLADPKDLVSKELLAQYPGATDAYIATGIANCGAGR